MVRDGVPQRYRQVVLAGYAIQQRSVSGVASVCCFIMGELCSTCSRRIYFLHNLLKNYQKNMSFEFWLNVCVHLRKDLEYFSVKVGGQALKTFINFGGDESVMTLEMYFFRSWPVFRIRIKEF
jgi:hypothetical protein